MVGSRNATPQGTQTAENFARALATRGLAIISGLALGIDAAAHRGALAAGGETIAVIGTGADRLYPARNQNWRWRLPNAAPSFPNSSRHAGHRRQFPAATASFRALSRGVLVVEAAPESGSLITARLLPNRGARPAIPLDSFASRPRLLQADQNRAPSWSRRPRTFPKNSETARNRWKSPRPGH